MTQQHENWQHTNTIGSAELLDVAHKYGNWRHVSIIGSIDLLDKDGNPLDVNAEPYTVFAGYVSSRPTRLVASTIPWKDEQEKECVIVGINCRWNEKIVDLYENIHFKGVEPNTSTQLRSYGAGVFPVEGWNFKDVRVEKDRELNPSEIKSFINFENSSSGEEVSVRWKWLVGI